MFSLFFKDIYLCVWLTDLSCYMRNLPSSLWALSRASELLVKACRTQFPDQGSNPGPLALGAQCLSLWRSPEDHQRSPQVSVLLKRKTSGRLFTILYIILGNPYSRIPGLQKVSLSSVTDTKAVHPLDVPAGCPSPFPVQGRRGFFGDFEHLSATTFHCILCRAAPRFSPPRCFSRLPPSPA